MQHLPFVRWYIPECHTFLNTGSARGGILNHDSDSAEIYPHSDVASYVMQEDTFEGQ